MQKFSIKIIFIILFLFIISYLLLFISRLGSKNIDNHYADNMENQENVQKSDASDEEDIDTSGTDGMGEESENKRYIYRIMGV